MKPAGSVGFEDVNTIGYEAFQHIAKRLEKLGLRSFEDAFPHFVGAVSVCVANVLGPTVEASTTPALALDKLLEQVDKQVRTILEPTVKPRE
jgi:hypothetical protein